jgi:putative ATP-dependent endonuclease of OLD family
MGISLNTIRIKNVRSIRDIQFELGNNTVLFGHNNGGKSNFLYAITLALEKARFEKEDLFFSDEEPYSEEREASVDLFFVPVDENGHRCGMFNDDWSALLGCLIGIDDNGSQFFGLHTTLSYDKDINGYRKIRRNISLWTDKPQLNSQRIPEKVMDCFDCTYMDAQRDISLDITDRQSFWNKRISNMNMPDELKTRYCETVRELNREIIDNNPILTDVRNNLDSIIPDGTISMHLIPEDVNKLHRGLEIGIDDGAGIISISNMGLGTRNLAVLSSIRTIINSDLEKIKTKYCIFLAEEPESHLHPSLQKSLVKEFKKMSAQTIITTHSPFFISKSDITDLVCCNHSKDGSKYTSLKGNNFSDKESKLLNRVFIERRAEALFSDLIILSEGKTELLALPKYFESYFGKTTDEMNVSVIDVGGSSDYKPLLIACNAFKIKWIIFSDGEEKTIKSLSNEINSVFGKGNFDQMIKEKIFIIPDGHCYEDLLIAEGCAEIIETTLSTGKYKNRFKNQKNDKKNKNPDLSNDELLSLILKMEDNKTEYATPTAKAISDAKKIPQVIKDMLLMVKKIIGDTI